MKAESQSADNEVILINMAVSNSVLEERILELETQLKSVLKLLVLINQPPGETNQILFDY